MEVLSEHGDGEKNELAGGSLSVALVIADMLAGDGPRSIGLAPPL